jgi:hypothetical protein
VAQPPTRYLNFLSFTIFAAVPFFPEELKWPASSPLYAIGKTTARGPQGMPEIARVVPKEMGCYPLVMSKVCY